VPDPSPSGDSARVRLFVAATIPDELLQRLARSSEPLRRRWPAARWTDPANQHVTLKFLGWADAGMLDDVHAACRAVASANAPAKLSLGELGAFPSARRARVLWVGLEDPAGLLARIARGLDESLEPLGFPGEKRAFTAHLTLARMKTPVGVGEWPDVEIDPTPWTSRTVTLFRSHLSPKGARYEALDEIPLGGSASGG
jgi:2'-5' RNA ligase